MITLFSLLNRLWRHLSFSTPRSQSQRVTRVSTTRCSPSCTIMLLHTGEARQPFVSLPGCDRYTQKSCQTHALSGTPKGSPSLGYFGSIYYPCQTLKLIIFGLDFSGECGRRLSFKEQFPPSSPSGFVLAAIYKQSILESITWSFQRKISFYQRLQFQSTKMSLLYTVPVQGMPTF